MSVVSKKKCLEDIDFLVYPAHLVLIYGTEKKQMFKEKRYHGECSNILRSDISRSKSFN